MKKRVIFYHGDCPDGFGGAYAAWKKFAAEAEYIPLKHGRLVPTIELGREICFIDFCYPKETMDALAESAADFVVLDHHEGVRSVVESSPKHIFDTKRSGATIAWNYFHPDEAVPILLRYVQAGDLYTFDMPDARAVLSYIYTRPFHFEEWDALCVRLENEQSREELIERGKIYYEYYSLMTTQIAARGEPVEFEGYEVYFAGASSQFISDVGHTLAQKKGPFALVAGVSHDGIRVSLRGDGSIDVSELARRHGGNGHPDAAAFFIPWGKPLPWKSAR